MIATKLTVSIERKLSRNYSTQSVRIGAEIELEEGDVFDDAAREWSERCKNLVREQLHPLRKETETQESDSEKHTSPTESDQPDSIPEPVVDQSRMDPITSANNSEPSHANSYKVGSLLRSKKHPDQEATIISFDSPDQWTIKSHVNGNKYECDTSTLIRVYEPTASLKSEDEDDDETNFDDE